MSPPVAAPVPTSVPSGAMPAWRMAKGPTVVIAGIPTTCRSSMIVRRAWNRPNRSRITRL